MKQLIYKEHSRSEKETIVFAKTLAKHVRTGDILLLYGDLGMGKTVFCRSFIRFLCGDKGMEVPSPTFTLLQTYDSKLGVLWHFDLYRLCDPDEIYEIGWEEALGRDDGVVLVEWPERLGDLMPGGAFEIYISGVEGAPESRVIEVFRDE